VVYGQWEYPHLATYHAASGTKTGCEGMVSKKVRVGLRGEVSSGTSGFALLVTSCLFKLGL